MLMLEHFTQDSRAGPRFRSAFACNLVCSVGKVQVQAQYHEREPVQALTVSTWLDRLCAFGPVHPEV